MGVSTVVFSNVEKIIDVYNRAVTPPPYQRLDRRLDIVTIEEIRAEMPYAAADVPTKYAISAHTADSVTIEINRVPQTAFTLYADAHQAVADLSGSNEPAFPESFHDIIIEGVMADELRKMEKPELSQIAQQEYNKLLSDLRMWVAKENALDIYQGKTATQRPHGGSGSGGSSFNGAQSWTQTGLITFDRDPSAPFAVTASSAKVDNLDADLLDGQSGAFYQSASNLNAGTVPVARLGAGVTTRIASTTTSNQDNWAPGIAGNTYLAWSGAGDIIVTGFSSTGVTTGMMLTIRNASGSNVMFLVHNSGSSSDGNKLFSIVTSVNTPIAPGGVVVYVYDAIANFWVMLSHEQGTTIAYTPTFTGLTIGNGTVIGEYRVFGKSVWWRATFQFGSTSTMGASLFVSLPVTALNAFNAAATAKGLILDSPSTYYVCHSVASTTSAVQLTNNGSPLTGIETTIPITWAPDDLLTIAGIYTAAT
jgi:hypothetical protein